MPTLPQNLAKYLHHTLGITLSPIPWTDAPRLPPFLTHRYQFLQAELLHTPILFMVDDDPREESPATIRKHLARVKTKWPHPVVYLRRQVTSYNRNRLIHHRIPFVIPGNQLYLPELGLDLREYFRKPPIEKPNFNPSTQATLIFALLRDSDEPLIATDLAPQLGYTPMTMSRAFDALEAADLAASESHGKERRLHFQFPRTETWERAKPYLRSPVTRRHYLDPASRKIPGLHAGLSALALCTMIAEPQNRITALSREQWQSLRQQKTIRELPFPEPDALEIEVWNYPPRPYRDETTVDPLSLYLSLQNDPDERIQLAIDNFMENLPW